mmetsp:Transcript_117204/g.239785  ORF Transcript_117204/g.239785 Transcript_117204/m.239785 type:complete len:105 (+) Transcript_117204:296-610(+)
MTFKFRIYYFNQKKNVFFRFDEPRFICLILAEKAMECDCSFSWLENVLDDSATKPLCANLKIDGKEREKRWQYRTTTATSLRLWINKKQVATEKIRSMFFLSPV